LRPYSSTLVAEDESPPLSQFGDLRVELNPAFVKQVAVDDTSGHVQLGFLVQRVVAEVDGLGLFMWEEEWGEKG